MVPRIMKTRYELLHPPLNGPFPPERVADPTFDLVVAELEKARESVEIFMYVWRADEAGIRVGEAVLAAAERGVKVRVIKDIGAIMCEVIEMNRKPFFPRRISLLKRIIYKIIGRTFPDTFVEDEYNQELGALLLSHPNVTVDWINKTHIKYYVFDERLLVTGSINIEDRHQNYFDYMVALVDPELVQRLRMRMAGEPPCDPGRNIDFLCNTHREGEESVFEIKPEVLRCIEASRESITSRSPISGTRNSQTPWWPQPDAESVSPFSSPGRPTSVMMSITGPFTTFTPGRPSKSTSPTP